MSSLKVTNPDSVINNYYFETDWNGEKIKVIPLLIAKSMYDEKKGGRFFDYLQLQFYAVDTENGVCQLSKKDGNYIILSLQQISNYFDRIGKNTNYIIHPDEILASNFQLLFEDSDAVKSPDLLKKIADELKK